MPSNNHHTIKLYRQDRVDPCSPELISLSGNLEEYPEEIQRHLSSPIDNYDIYVPDLDLECVTNLGESNPHACLVGHKDHACWRLAEKCHKLKLLAKELGSKIGFLREMLEDSREETRIAKKERNESRENEAFMKEKMARMEAEMAETSDTLVLFELASKILYELNKCIWALEGFQALRRLYRAQALDYLPPTLLAFHLFADPTYVRPLHASLDRALEIARPFIETNLNDIWITVSAANLIQHTRRIYQTVCPGELSLMLVAYCCKPVTDRARIAHPTLNARTGMDWIREDWDMRSDGSTLYSQVYDVIHDIFRSDQNRRVLGVMTTVSSPVSEAAYIVDLATPTHSTSLTIVDAV